MKESKHKKFKVNQDAVLIGPSGKILILKQPKDWQLPGGRLENDPTIEVGLMREFFEETGIKDIEIERILAIGLSESKKTYRATFLCHADTEIVELSHEHTDYKWVEVKEALNYNFQHKGIYEILKSLI